MQTLAPIWNLSNTATAKWYLRLFPSLQDLAFLLPILVLFAKFKGTELLFADGDTGWHIRTGEWILSHRAVPTVDLFSFTKASQPWFAWEWGWDVCFALVHSCAGLAGVAFVTCIMLGLFSLLLYRLAVRVSHDNLMSIAVTAIATGVSSIHWLARPHLVSWIFTLLFLNAIVARQQGRLRALLLLPVLMIVWVNLHGGFIAGLLVLGCYAFGEALTAVVRDNLDLASALRRSGPYWQSLGLCLLVTFVNPYGWLLHSHIYTYLTDSELLDKIQEFQSISFHAGPALLLEIMLLLGAFTIFSKLRQLDFSPVLLLCLWAHYALFSARHIPLFMLVAAPFAAELLAQTVAHVRRVTALLPAAEVIGGIAADFRMLEGTPRVHLTSAAALLVMAACFAAGRAPFAAQFNPENFPLQAIPVLTGHPDSRIFTTDQWADYLLYRLYPAQRVFFDGRSDFYGNDFIKINQRINSAEHDWKSLLQQFAINVVVLKPETPLSAALKLTPGSKVLFDDGKVIVFDVAGIYHLVPGRRNTAIRAVSSSLTLPTGSAAVALTFNPLVHSQKG